MPRADLTQVVLVLVLVLVVEAEVGGLVVVIAEVLVVGDGRAREGIGIELAALLARLASDHTTDDTARNSSWNTRYGRRSGILGRRGPRRGLVGHGSAEPFLFLYWLFTLLLDPGLEVIDLRGPGCGRGTILGILGLRELAIPFIGGLRGAHDVELAEHRVVFEHEQRGMARHHGVVLRELDDLVASVKALRLGEVGDLGLSPGPWQVAMLDGRATVGLEIHAKAGFDRTLGASSAHDDIVVHRVAELAQEHQRVA